MRSLTVLCKTKGRSELAVCDLKLFALCHNFPSAKCTRAARNPNNKLNVRDQDYHNSYSKTRRSVTIVDQ